MQLTWRRLIVCRWNQKTFDSSVQGLSNGVHINQIQFQSTELQSIENRLVNVSERGFWWERFCLTLSELLAATTNKWRNKRRETCHWFLRRLLDFPHAAKFRRRMIPFSSPPPRPSGHARNKWPTVTIQHRLPSITVTSSSSSPLFTLEPRNEQKLARKYFNLNQFKSNFKEFQRNWNASVSSRTGDVTGINKRQDKNENEASRWSG